MKNDNTVPNPPIFNLTTATHKLAKSVEDTSCFKDASFDIYTSKNSKYGIKGFYYSLFKFNKTSGEVSACKCNGKSVVDMLIETNGSANLIFNDLEDNEKDEFYKLLVKTLGNNGIISSESEYIFRIDTRPPENYIIYLKPQIDNSVWYSSTKSELHWVEKRDSVNPNEKTGVKKYEYRILPRNGKNNTDIEFVTIDDTSNSYIPIDLPGSCDAEMRFTDYAGNITNERIYTSVNIDTIPPIYEGNKPSGKFLNENTIVINWDSFKDVDGSGLNRLEFSFTKLTNDSDDKELFYYTITDLGNYNSNPKDNQYEFELDFSDKNAYLVNITCYDNVGNNTIESLIVQPDSPTDLETVSLTIPYEMENNNFKFSGNVDFSPMDMTYSNFVGTVTLPIMVSYIDPITSREIQTRTLNIAKSVFSSNRIVEAYSDVVTSGIKVSLNNEIIYCESIGYSSEKGLIFSKLTYPQTIVTSGNNIQNFTFSTDNGFAAYADFFPMLNLSTTTASVINNPVKIKENDCVFEIGGISTLRFISGIKYFTGNLLTKSNKFSIYQKIDNKNVYEILLNEVKSNPKNKSLAATVNCNNLFVLLNGLEYKINAAEINNNVLRILSATTQLTINNNDYLLVLNDFTIDEKTGIVDSKNLEILCYDSEKKLINRITDKTVSFDISSIYLDSDGNLVTDKASHEYLGFISGVIIEKDSLNFSKTNLSNRGLNIYGFQIFADRLVPEEDAILINNGSITIYNEQYTFENLKLNYACSQVLSNCNINGSFEKDITKKYKAVSKYTNLCITSSGVTATICVPVNTEEGVQEWIFENAVLNPVADDGCLAEDTLSRKLKYGTFYIETNKVLFDGKQITIESGEIDLHNLSFYANEEKINLINFVNLSFNYEDLIHDGQINYSDIIYKFRGWNFYITESFRIGKSLLASGLLYKQNENNLLILHFDDFKIFSNNTIESGVSPQEIKDDEDKIFVNNNYIFTIDSGELISQGDDYLLKAGKLIFTIDTDVTVPLYFSDVYITKNLDIVNNYIDEQKVSFESANEYLIETNAAGLNSKGITLSGNLSTKALASKTNFTNNEICLTPDFIVTAQSDTAEITYRYNGWDIVGCGVNYAYQSITIVENYLNFNNSTIEVGELKFNSDNVLYNSSVKQQDVNTKFLNSNGKILLSRFSNEGLNVRAEVNLPKPFENISLVFDKIYIEPDGNYYVKSFLQNKSFTIGGVSFDFTDITIGSQGLYVDSFDISIAGDTPFKISMEGLNITPEGKVYVTGRALTPFKFLGMTYIINELSLKEDGIYFEGYTYLPSSLPGVLSELTVSVNHFFMNYEGTVFDLDIKTKGQYTIPIGTDWGITFTEVGIEANNGKFDVVLKGCGLLFPSEYNVKKVVVSDIHYDLINNSFDFDSIDVTTEIPLEISGIKFVLSKIQISSDWTFGFGGTASFGENYPEFLRNTNTEAFISFSPSYGIKEVLVSATNLSGPISKDIKILELKNGSIIVKKDTSSSLYISISGGLWFTDAAPSGMQNLELGIKEFTYDGKNQEIIALGAYAKNMHFTLDGIALKDLSAEVVYNKETNGYVMLGGKIVLPDSLPDGIKGTEIKINKFNIGFNGSVEFDAGYSNKGPVSAYGGLILSNIDIGVGYLNGSPKFMLAGDVLLDNNKFPSGLGGLKSSIELRVNGNSLEYGHALFSLQPGTKIFDTFTVKSLNMEFTATSTNALEFVVTNGTLILPDQSKLPQGLANASINIKKFRMNSNGELLDFDLGGVFQDFTLYNFVSINNSSIGIRSHVVKSNKYDFEFEINGETKLISPSLPKELKDTTFEIRNLRFSTLSGIKEFNIGLKNSIEFTILKGLKVTLNSLDVSNEGFACAAMAELNYDGPMKNTSFKLTRLYFDWNFKIKDIQGGLEQTTIEIAGFKGTIKKLYFIKDTSATDGYSIMLDECKVTLPANVGSMGGKSLGIKNAIFRNGKFEGTFIVPAIEANIVGFVLKCNEPQFDYANSLITFKSVSLDMPETFKSATIKLSGVSISASKGLQFKGGKFKIPDFKISDGVGFEGLYVSFVLNGSQYEIAGEGGLSIANCGSMNASVSFTNVSKTYPIGLKSAYFSFEASTGGIPLGTTGLKMNGIKGGLEYGSPSSVPSSMRYLFDNNGIRIQLGLTLSDAATSGSLLQMKPTTWIDVKNLSFAFSGQLYVLKGTFDLSATAEAGLSKYGFYSGLSFTLKVVKGEIEFYVFDQNGVKFSGKGYCQFGIQKGALLDKTIKILWKKVNICIPTSSIWLSKVGTEFGYFGSAGNGFKAYASISGFGKFGIFVGGKNNIKLGNVDSYTLVTPKPNYGINNNLLNVVNFNQVNNFTLLNTSFNSAGIIDLSSLDYTYDDTYDNSKTHRFRINGKSNPGVTINQSTVSQESSLSKVGILQNTLSNQSIRVAENESGLDRIIFVCSYLEGNPVFCAVSPSGKRYSTADENVETTYFENSIAFIVYNPEAGDWDIIAENIEEDTYSIDLLTVEAENEVTILEPSWNKKKADDTLYVKGAAVRANSIVHVYASETKDSSLFELGTIVTDANGNYEGNISTDNIFDGEYYIIVKGESSSGELSPAVYSSGTYLIDRSELTLLPPVNFLITEKKHERSITDDDTCYIQAVWENPNGNRTTGYKIKLTENDETREYDVGNINTYRLLNLESGTDIYLSICAYGEKGLISDYTEPLHVIINSEKLTVNAPVVIEPEININAEAGNTINTSLTTRIKDFVITDSVQDYIRGDIIKVNNIEEYYSDYFIISIGDLIKIQSDYFELPVDITLDDNCPVGNYEIKGSISNEGNESLTSEFTIRLNVQYPTLQIESIEPEQLDGSVDSKLFIYGNGFADGSRYYFNDKELTLDENEVKSLKQQCLNIPACYARGEKELKIVNPEGKELRYPINIVYPDWDAYVLVDSVKIKAGEYAIVPINIESLDGYTGVVSLKAVNVPSGLSVTIPELSLDSIFDIKIDSASELISGDYTILLGGNNGKQFEIPVVIEEREVEEIPYITQIAPYSAFEGDKVTIYGSGFGNEGHLIFDKTEIQTDSWSSTAITFTVASGMKTGILYIVKGEKYSNATRLIIYERGFEIKSNESIVKIKRNISKTIPLYINGYAKKVDLDINMDSTAPFKAVLNNNSVIPNGMTSLVITGNTDAINGTWDVTITGNADSYITTNTITVIIEDSIELDSTEIYKGKVGVPYKAQLYTRNSEGIVEFKLLSGKLPAGLTLTSNGTIYGTPSESCECSAVLCAQDSDGQFIEQTVELIIIDDSWAISEKDSGYTRSTETEMPSTDSIAWKIATSVEDSGLIISDQKIYTYNESLIKAYNDNGRFLWQLLDKVKKIQSTSNNILVLTDANVLYAIDKKFGNSFWQREGVLNFTTAENVIVTEEQDGSVVLNVKDGSAISVNESLDVNFETCIWVGNKLYTVKDSTLSCVYGANASVQFDSNILSVSADSNGFVIVTMDAIYVLDSSLKTKVSLPHIFDKESKIQTGMDSSAIFVNYSGLLTEYNRETLEPVWIKSDTNCFAIANEKAILLCNNKIEVLNRYTGKQVWTKEGPYCSIALYGENIYAQTTNGELYRFNGIPNATAPETTIVIDPEIPTGTQDWYNTTPIVSVVSIDKETYVKSVMVNYNNSEWAEYETEELVKDGYSMISAYGIDSKGFRGEQTSKSIKVDTVKPVTQYSISNRNPVNEWVSEGVTITLSAYDELSGVSSIICNDKEYSTELTYSNEGIHHVEWYAVDNAGNMEEPHSFDVMIDKYAPTTGINVKYANGIAVVYLSAQDTGSGLDRIEYSINGKSRQEYKEPVVIINEGINNFEWEAFDVSGKSSGIKTSAIRIAKNAYSLSSLALPELNGKAQNVGYPLDYGTMLLKNDFKNWSDVPSDFWQKAYSSTLPEFVLKGEFILWNGTDMHTTGNRIIGWYLKKDSVIYLFADKNIKLDEDWKLINSNSHIQDSVHPEGFHLYMKRGFAGEQISVSLNNNIKDLPLIVVKPLKTIQTEIKLNRNAVWDDVYYNGRKLYRSGVQVVLSNIIKPQNPNSDLPVTEMWTYVFNGVEHTLPSLWYTLPEVKTPTEITFRFKIVSADGVIESISEKTILIEVPDDPNSLYPWNRH